MNPFLLYNRRLLIALVQALLIALALWLALALRHDVPLPPAVNIQWQRLLPVALALKIVLFYVCGLFRGWWRYISLDDLLVLLRGNLLASLALALVVGLAGTRLGLSPELPLAVLLLDGLLCFLLMTAVRVLTRLFRERYYPHADVASQQPVRLLLAGAGRAGQAIARELRFSRQPGYQLVGFVDDDDTKQKTSFQGVAVLGRCDELPQLCQRYDITQVIIAIPSAQRQQIRRLVELCRSARVTSKILPSVSELIDGSVSVNLVKDVALEDLLGRQPVRLDTAGIAACLRDQVVFVSGAGGSIGSELCRQIARFAPARLILFENAETPLFAIEQELVQRFPRVPIVPVLGDIRYRARVEAIFDEQMPQVVFHAAAYKHVPMVECNPAEAVNNNIRGTQVLAETSSRFGVDRFVMISTDKAVNPTSIMGATKRVAEQLVQALARRSRTCFVTVRFGNVLGSNGSVVPIFKEQIARGGPVTVTHPEVTRFFMTIPEATQLVLQAAAMGQGGEIFLLDMGEPMKVLHLAEELIRLSGKVPYREIAIQYTGLRPGEKLYEELLLAAEGVKSTPHEKICIAAGVCAQDENLLLLQVEQLYNSARRLDLTAVVEGLRQLVPEFKPERLGPCRHRPQPVRPIDAGTAGGGIEG
ncbi:polysaccharide biosynthesis protein [Desulfuromonas thiophila]|uniref:polysaccharide biosynthesis protein n=1 Tax=Desulfuromonas thiophila TaxID=57664 RepID=UPI0024A7BCAA|nr:nucleoside-diphosphate sugar epimerase/dehydratase [Desulfuromonas thiophila]